MSIKSVIVGLVLMLATNSQTALAADPVEFNRDVRPILSNSCFECHGFDSKQRQGGLRLDLRDSALRKLKSGSIAIVPGNTKASELVRRISATDDDRMPPADHAKQLTAKQIAVLTEWVRQGAEYQQHWSFLPPTRPKKPSVRQQEWARNGIDGFVLRKLEQRGLVPAQEASRETLIRRVAFDLTGLPPTLAEIDAFLADNEPGAFERVVDHYLKSDAYGEHMSRHWMDLARYADTNGYQYDTERQMWVWRDWVIDAYNQNMPFDQFTINQLAGDLRPNATPTQRLATGFNRNHGITIEGGVIDEEYRTEYVMDRVVTTSAVWLGLTMGCARCHDHKFDPISQQDFYRFFAFFNQVPERGNNGFNPKFQVTSPLAAAQHKEIDQQIAQLRSRFASLAENVDSHLQEWVDEIARSRGKGWSVLVPVQLKSSGGSTMTKLDDHSVLVGQANPNHDVYDITARTDESMITAVRLEALTHPSLPGGGPGRHTNSNFVLSEFELTAVSVKDPAQSQVVKFSSATADYSQKGYHIGNAIDGRVGGNNGWAVDGPTRKKPCTAVFVAAKPFGYKEGTELRFKLRHEATFWTHGIGRPRLSVTGDNPAQIAPSEIPAAIRRLAGLAADKRSATETKQLREYFLASRNKHAQAQIARLEQRKSASFPATMVMVDMPKPRATHVLIRGEYNQPGELVTAGVPGIFPPLAKSVSPNRLAMAKWLVNGKHPLTSRVAVNRYWQRCFGTGLVKTSEDFGTQGEYPSHPELLDWLATEFVNSGWDVKAMQRLIVTSATYRQSSAADRASFRRDPENRLLSRAPRLRLDAEQIRDSALATSGLLVRRLGGKSVYSYQPAGLWIELNNRPGYSRAYTPGKGEDLYRRSLYTFGKRTVPSPMMSIFDAPEREFCTVRRSRTNTPLQALLVQNGTQFVEAARLLARRMMLEQPGNIDDRISYGFRLTTARRPTEEEVAILRNVYQSRLQMYKQNDSAAMKLLGVGGETRDTKLDPAEHAAWTVIGRLLLNLDETITRG